MLSKPNYYYPRGGGGVVKTIYKAKLSSVKLPTGTGTELGNIVTKGIKWFGTKPTYL